MTPAVLILGLAIVFFLTIGHLALALAKRKALVAGRGISREHNPIGYWALLSFDLFVIVFCIAVFLDLIGVGVQ